MRMRSWPSAVACLAAGLFGLSCGQTPPAGERPAPKAPIASARVLAVGDMAPEFSLAGSDGRQHSLADHRGRQSVVLAWFSKAFSEGWTAQCHSLRESGNQIRDFDVAYFSISVDSPDTNQKFAQSLGVDYPILSDPARTVATAYGVVDADQPFASRWTFYIGTDGRITYIDKHVSPATHGQAVVAKLAELGVPRRR